MKWYKIEFETGDSKYDQYGQEQCYWDVNSLKKTVKEQVKELTNWFHVRKIKITKLKTTGGEDDC